MDNEQLISEREAAVMLGNIHPGTLANWRSEGKGPKYIKVGFAVRYKVGDVRDWLAGNTK